MSIKRRWSASAIGGIVAAAMMLSGCAGIPADVRTPMADNEMDALVAHLELSGRDEAYTLVTSDLPLPRVAEPADIAAAVRFLGSAESGYITGAVLVVDGGAHIVDLPTLAFDRLRG